MRELAGGILIGGQSKRMGRDKAMLTLPDGRSMMDAVAHAMRAVCEEIVAVGSVDFRQAKHYVQVPDFRPHAGPLGGIEALLSSEIAHAYIVCPCDLPRINAALLRSLLEHRHTPATVFKIAGSAHFEPLPARIAASALPTVRKMLNDDERSVWRLMERLPAAIIEIDQQSAAALRNVNTPGDFNTL